VFELDITTLLLAANISIYGQCFIPGIEVTIV